jgi:hypothetical protein
MAERPRRVNMKATSEAMRGWAEALAAEVKEWPGVTVKNAFGMSMVYRNGVVFAALPKTRALYEEDAILIKFNAESSSLSKRIANETRFAGTMEQSMAQKHKTTRKSKRWRILRIHEDADVHAAIEWLAEAYGVARKDGRRTG